jgi:putative oxidoreductase
MNSTMDKLGLILGRFLLALIFVISGFGKIVHFADTATMMAGAGIPLAKVALVFTILIELGGGLLLITGFYVRYAALIMALFMVPVTLVFHKFWGLPNPEHDMQLAHFIKNIAITGGLLVAAFSSRSSSRRTG